MASSNFIKTFSLDYYVLIIISQICAPEHLNIGASDYQCVYVVAYVYLCLISHYLTLTYILLLHDWKLEAIPSFLVT